MAATIEAIRQLKFELLPHPSHSPDLAPSDCHMFGPLKETFVYGGASDDEVKDVTHTWLQLQPNTFFVHGIIRPADCYAICVEKKWGDHVEK